MGKPLPHGALEIDGGAPAPPLELPPAELPLAPSCSFHCPSSRSAMHRCPCNTSGPGCRSDLSRFQAFAPKRTQPAVRSQYLAPSQYYPPPIVGVGSYSIRRGIKESARSPDIAPLVWARNPLK
jgi:hypothetical protein